MNSGQYLDVDRFTSASFIGIRHTTKSAALRLVPKFPALGASKLSPASTRIACSK